MRLQLSSIKNNLVLLQDTTLDESQLPMGNGFILPDILISQHFFLYIIDCDMLCGKILLFSCKYDRTEDVIACADVPLDCIRLIPSLPPPKTRLLVYSE